MVAWRTTLLAAAVDFDGEKVVASVPESARTIAALIANKVVAISEKYLVFGSSDAIIILGISW